MSEDVFFLFCFSSLLMCRRIVFYSFPFNFFYFFVSGTGRRTYFIFLIYPIFRFVTIDIHDLKYGLIFTIDVPGASLLDVWFSLLPFLAPFVITEH